MREIFVPPGVQARLFERIGLCPRQASESTAKRIELLWQKRNTADEGEVADIDNQMFEAVIDDHRVD
ncbi:MAG: hypothetical protein QM845_06855 [Verrucomicrobiota bacterium]|nr:hypothetical protein [Verrucomicrobiota bacterium]